MLREKSAVRSLSIATAASALLLAALTLTLPRGAFSGDEGVKLVQALALLESSFVHPDVPYPGRVFDPAEDSFPLRRPFVVGTGGHRYGIYPVTFVAPLALAWRLFGHWGLYLLPLLCGIWVVYLTMRFIERATGDRRWAITGAALLLVATPVSLYSTLCSEHVPGLACFVAGLLVLSDDEARTSRLLLAGAALGMAATLRGELVAAAPAVILFALLLHGARSSAKRLGIAGLGAAVVFGAYVLYNRVGTGHWLPALAANLAEAHPRRSAYLALVFDTRTGYRSSSLYVQLATLLVGLVALSPRIPRHIVLAAASLVTLAFCWLAYIACSQIEPGWGNHRHTIGLFSTTPLLLLGLYVGLADRTDDSFRVARACTAAAVVLVIAIVLTNADPSVGGLQLGSRHLLTAVPLLLVSTLVVVRSLGRLGLALSVVPLAISLWASSINYTAEVKVRELSATLITGIERSGVRDVVTDAWWVPQIIAPLWPTHRIYLISSPELLERLRAGGVTHVVQAFAGVAPYEASGLVRAEGEPAAYGVVKYRLSAKH